MAYASFPHHLWPVSTHFFQQRLFLGKHDLGEIARRLGSPLYLYDLATIDHAIGALRRGLRAWPGPGLITYASKAWLSLPLAQLLTRRGLGFDVVSLGELEIAQRGGADLRRVHLHGNNKSPDLLARAADAGVGAIVVDNLHELSLLEAMKPPAPLALWLRLNPDQSPDTHAYRQTGHEGSKFGLNWEEAQEAARRIARAPHLRLTGLHAHIGSQFFELTPWFRAIDRLVALAAWVEKRHLGEIRFLSPGGGLGVPYHPDDPPARLAETVARLSRYAAGVWRNGLSGSFPTLTLEPGRSLIARAGVALYTVGAVRHLASGQRIIAVDGGMNDNMRPALYGARYTAALAHAPLAAAMGPARIVGPLCESGDFLIERIDLPEVQPEDILATPVSGAYHLSMASNYNGMLRPAVYLHARGDLVPMQRRETVADLLHRDIPLENPSNPTGTAFKDA
ncbi:MAG TPA: diaminopimelate decarboxylase [Caldilineae bacterium]|nr:diaminopimelate decarboxylase [Caldilineae bacterium]